MYLDELIAFLKTSQENNRKELRNNIDSNDLKFKLQNFLKKHSLNLSLDVLKRMIIENNVVAATFAKDVLKQNLIEKFVAKKIAGHKSVKSCEVLSKSGRNAIYVDRGQIRSGKEYKNKETLPSKSIDFQIILNNKKILYATHKYTTNTGGHQDNQKNDVIKFISNASGKKRNFPNIIAILDGTYWTKAKMKEVEVYATQNIKILNDKTLAKFLIKISQIT